jgi:hypothetical protein
VRVFRKVNTMTEEFGTISLPCVALRVCLRSAGCGAFVRLWGEYGLTGLEWEKANPGIASRIWVLFFAF